MDDVTLAVGYGLHLCRCKNCGHYFSADTLSLRLARPRCPNCASAMVVVDPSAEELRQINDWLDTQLLVEYLAEHPRHAAR